MILDWRKIESVLNHDLEQARVAFDLAKENFTTVTSDVPSGIPQPDGTLRLEQTGIAFRSAMDAYSVALREFNNFLIDGTVPDRLKQSRSAQSREE